MSEPMEGNRVGSEGIDDGGVATADIADGAVTVPKVAEAVLQDTRSAGESLFLYLNFY